MASAPLAHSAKDAASAPQLYADHVGGVAEGARRHAQEMLAYAADASLARQVAAAVGDAAEFHDLGKLDPDTQARLRRGRGAKLNWDHIDAGVAHLSSAQAMTAAWLVFSHHAPGLPSKSAHFGRGNTRKLRGGRKPDFEDQTKQINHTDAHLGELLALHRRVCGATVQQPSAASHGLAMRLALSCLVDADHADTACADGAAPASPPPPPRWEERLAALDAYVAGLAKKGGARAELRAQFYQACRQRAPDAAMIACEGPVGIGKTTAVLAYLLRRAIETGARRLFVVAPFTTILTQTVEVLRAALVLPDERERPFDIVAEHHHRADFSDIASRDLATLWTAPVVLTTAVQFLETLSSNEPSKLRKLHMLPGSVVFVDEAHALAPISAIRRRQEDSEGHHTLILPQYWRWLRELAQQWRCSFAFASGSLARFWRIEEVAEGDATELPDLVPPALAPRLARAEALRVRYVTHPRFADIRSSLQTAVAQPGPRLFIMNTVQSAAIVAEAARAQGHDVLHLSNALCPRDRETLLMQIRQRLADGRGRDWCLVATSLVEAGVDISFATAFRERFGLTSLLQIAGRVNRHGEFGAVGEVHDFVIESVDGLSQHPEARIPGEVLFDLLREGRLEGEFDAARLVTESWRRQIERGKRATDLLGDAERRQHYPNVAELGRLIQTDTRLVVVDKALEARLLSHAPVPAPELLAGSVQIWAQKIRALGLDEMDRRPGVFRWPHEYDPAFLGYMAGALKIAAVARGDVVII